MSEVKNIIKQNKEAMIVPDGIIVISMEEKIIVFNEAASRITGFTEDDIINKNFAELFKSKPAPNRLYSTSTYRTPCLLKFTA